MGSEQELVRLGQPNIEGWRARFGPWAAISEPLSYWGLERDLNAEEKKMNKC